MDEKVAQPKMESFASDIVCSSMDLWDMLVKKLQNEGYAKDEAERRTAYLIKFTYLLYCQKY